MSVTVYDEENDEEVQMGRVPIEDNCEEFLRTLYDAEEYLSTQTIKSLTGLTRQNIHYRYNKFGRKTYTEIIDVREVEDDYLPRHKDQMLEAALTDKGEKLIDQGLLGDPNAEMEQETVEITKERYEDMEEEIDSLHNQVNALRDQLNELERSSRKNRTEIEQIKSGSREWASSHWQRRRLFRRQMWASESA
ncbi:hypothetical protein [Haloarcula regularis]|uniref:hypothetical protein n=1 Tax=Haloarcula regularis TaxID=3033392 RepID=UPI0023E7FEF2|nr:hypothetical protein [Halomicroarcula sp. SYNS111]